MKKSLILLPVMLAIAGCATSPFGTATSGGANYSYSKTADGDCSVTINSAREIAGATLSISNDCGVTVSADSANGAAALGVISNLVNKIPAGKIP